MIQLVPIRKVIDRRGMKLSINQFMLRSGVSLNTARRYWYNAQSGVDGGAPLQMIHFPTIQRVADALGVDWRDLLEDSDDNAN